MSLEELKKLQKKADSIFSIGMVITLIFVVIILIIIKPIMFGIFFSFFCLIFGFIISNIISSGPRKKLIDGYKNTFVLKALNLVFTDLKYVPEKGLDKSVIQNTYMMDMGDHYSSNDYVSGKYKNIQVVQSDVYISEDRETTDSDGNRKVEKVTIFRGKWMIFDFNKQFKANIQVCQKGFTNSEISRWGELRYKRVMMEDQEFNSNFIIFAQSEHEAFYILTPHLMEKIKNLVNMINGRVLLCFVDNKLHVGVENNTDSFEPRLLKNKNENEIMESILKDIKGITAFVDELDLDNDLFRKEV